MVEPRTHSITELVQQSGFDRRTIVYYIQQGLLPRAGRRGPNTRYPEGALLRLRFVRGLKDLQDQGRYGTITLADMRALLERLEDHAIRGMLERYLPPEEVAALQAGIEASAPRPAAPTPPAQGAQGPGHAAVTPPLASAPNQPALHEATRPQPAYVPAPSQPAVGDGRRYGLADAAIRRVPALAATPTRSVDGLHQQARTAGMEPSPAPAASAPLPSTTPMAAGMSSPSGMPPAEDTTALDPDAAPAGVPMDLGELLRELEVRPALAGRRLAPGASEQWTEIPITSRIYLSVRGLSESDAPLADATGRALKKLLRAR